MEEEKKGQGFVVRDKRHFDEAGNPRGPESTEKPDIGSGAGPDARLKAEKEKPDRPPETREESAYHEVDGVGFILSLSTTAMSHFGDIPDPYTQKREKNLAAAKQTIDILSLLQEKTRGNLDQQEREILEEALYELRMRFVKEQGAA